MDIIEDRSAEVWPPPPEEPAPEAYDFRVDALPYAVHGTRISAFRAGDAMLEDGALRITGRDNMPEEQRRRMYLLGGFGFVPGIVLTYALIESAPWNRIWLEIDDDDLLYYTCSDEYSLVSLVYKSHEMSDPPAIPNSLTFQLTKQTYRALLGHLNAHFPGKARRASLHSPISPGPALNGLLGIAFWTIVGILLLLKH